MALTDDDVREILRLIDESELDELHVETEGFSLHVPQDGGAAAPRPEASAPLARCVAESRRPSVTIVSPMLGVFYRAGAPGATPFVEVGAPVQPDTTVCIIEVMKMMNSVPAGVSGTIAEICFENADPRRVRRSRSSGCARHEREPGAPPIELVDTSIRDGNQSLWSATGLTTPEILAIAPTLDRVGYHAVDFSSSTHMAVSVRFHREDPWERIRLPRARRCRTRRSA